ncbi:MAG: hypothetical protein JWP97_6494 [Labilithrix sp.]|nr:hypothetical protein [Labilithrix sp.]
MTYPDPVRLADAPADSAPDGASITLAPALFGAEKRLAALFAPFRECVLLHETLIRDRGTSGPTRLLAAELREDRYDEVCNAVRKVCFMGEFTEKPSENDDVAAGTEWHARVGTFTVIVYRLLGGSTSIHVTSAKGTALDAALTALGESPLAELTQLVTETSAIEQISCSRSANAPPQWHLQASLREARRFEEIATRVRAIGFEERGRTYWRGPIVVRAVGKNRWMAATPGIEDRAR